ncbi:hypothetical protein ABE060_18895 [Bacillus rugosus]|uniref:hypothetical protein n=1 Tax=Bacillus TaxID=1386 RepID=UPI001421161E|nr:MULTISPECIES: hypothetical protein [Bacillus]MEC3664981.1 hypothetical protein [Bacillus subtilis]NUF07827.1 hypothetical protein [Bacillus rugosus]
MKKVWVKHVMDDKKRKMTLNEAFMEALQLSEGTSDIFENQEYTLFVFLSQCPKYINHISEEYKKSVLKSWDYEIIG